MILSVFLLEIVKPITLTPATVVNSKMLSYVAIRNYIICINMTSGPTLARPDSPDRGREFHDSPAVLYVFA